jgi:hypothetical protein
MTIASIPLIAAPAQTLATSLGRQYVRINLYFRAYTGLLCDVLVSDELIIGGVACHDRNRIVRDAWLGFTGDLSFVDQRGHNDPDWRELGSRYLLLWYSPEEIPAT